NLEKERKLRRGHGQAGMNVVDRYESASPAAEISLEEYTDLQALERHLLAVKPTLIHIVTGFLQAQATREIYMDLAQEVGSQSMRSGESGVRLTASYLKSLLERLPRDRPPPFVILEATLPSDEYERVRQVLLRNAFAAELLSFTRIRGILATGLFSYKVL